MRKMKNLWFAKLVVIVFLGIALAGLMTESASAIAAVQSAMYYGVLYFSFRQGAGSGAFAGVACGVAETLRQEDMAPLGLFCLMGVLAGTFRRLGRVPTVIAFFCGALGIGSLYALEYMTGSVPQMVTGAVLFLLTPAELLESAAGAGKMDGMEKLQRFRLLEASASYGKLAQSLVNVRTNQRRITPEQASEAVRRTSAMVCGGCRQCSLGKGERPGKRAADSSVLPACGVQESAGPESPEEGIDALCRRWEEKGCVEAEDLPEDFRSECRRREMYLETLGDCLAGLDYDEGCKSRFFESREAASLQFREMERVLREMAERMGQEVNVTGSVEKRVRRTLRRIHLKLYDLLVLEGDGARQEAYVTVSAGGEGCVTVKELCDSVGRTMEKNMRAAEGGRTVVGKEPCTIRLVEDTSFRLLSGVARVCKDDEEISGDSFSAHMLPDGRMMLCLSDGMGSGRRAFLESKLLTELMEELLEAGFSPERAIYMLNALMLVREEEQRPATLDLTLVDLYTGRVRFFKQGAVSTFIRRGTEVAEIEPGSLPMGMDCEAGPVSAHGQLRDGDMIVMVTDGVLDALKEEDKEAAMRRLLAESTTLNARELAEQVLRAGWSEDEEARDDMTVLVAGVWKK